MKKKNLIALMCCILAITVPLTTAAADTSSKVGEAAVFYAKGTGSSQTGSSDTEADNSKNDGQTSTDSTEAKENKETNKVLSKIINSSMSGEITDTSGIMSDGEYIYIESIKVPTSNIKDFLNQAKYNKGAGYDKVTTSDKNRNPKSLTNEEKAIMNSFIGGNIGMDINSSNAPANKIDFGSLNKRTDWPTMSSELNSEELADFMEKLKEHHYTIPELGGDGLKDTSNLADRYEYIEQYANMSSITDTVNVQHIIEYTMKQRTSKTLYKEQQIEYPGGGYYNWDIECVDSDETSAIGRTQNLRTQSGVLITQFGTPGKYHITAKENIAKTFVSSITYDMNEYWVLADTGQVIYKKLSSGYMGNTDSVGGRLSDKNTVYYNMTTEYAYGTGDETALAGEVIFDTYHTVTADMLEGVFPATGVYDLGYNTVRIE